MIELNKENLRKHYSNKYCVLMETCKETDDAKPKRYILNFSLGIIVKTTNDEYMISNKLKDGDESLPKAFTLTELNTQAKEKNIKLNKDIKNLPMFINMDQMNKMEFS
jgi:hypothetical protein